MAKLIACPECNKHLQVPEDLFGKQVRCPECKHTFTPQADPEPESPPPVPSSIRPKPKSTPPPDELDSEDEVPARRRRGSTDDDADDNDDDRPVRRRRSARRSYFTPHRAGMILAFGIIALVLPNVGIVFGLIAWFMGTSDLREIHEGRMDPEGESMTQAGRIMGIIATALWGVSILALCVFFVFYFFCVGFVIFGAAANANRPPGPQRRP
jgi:hypothetical protein